jgi:hypothetical protein
VVASASRISDGLKSGIGVEQPEVSYVVLSLKNLRSSRCNQILGTLWATRPE